MSKGGRRQRKSEGEEENPPGPPIFRPPSRVPRPRRALLSVAPSFSPSAPPFRPPPLSWHARTPRRRRSRHEGPNLTQTTGLAGTGERGTPAHGRGGFPAPPPPAPEEAPKQQATGNPVYWSANRAPPQFRWDAVGGLLLLLLLLLLGPGGRRWRRRLRVFVVSSLSPLWGRHMTCPFAAGGCPACRRSIVGSNRAWGETEL